jgi:hypothetical protein
LDGKILNVIDSLHKAVLLHMLNTRVIPYLEKLVSCTCANVHFKSFVFAKIVSFGWKNDVLYVMNLLSNMCYDEH